jgi:mono/diheme cytochrome c family protein
VLPMLVANSAGYAATVSSAGPVAPGNPFFQPFGNGRSCASCHNPQGGWSIVPADLALRFALSKGTDPVFRTHDGSTSPNAAVATLEQKRQAYALLLSKGLIRIGMPFPANAEFILLKVDDPYGFASARQMSLFRRPPPSTNLKFVSAVMWDGRVTLADPKGPCIIDSRPAQCFAGTDVDLQLQANFAVLDHAEAAQGLTAAQQRAIVDFEMSLSTAQLISHTAGPLNLAGARGGPYELLRSKYYFGINDVEAGDYRSGAAFNRSSMTLYTAWQPFAALPVLPPSPPLSPASIIQARGAIARGEQLFNTKAFNISAVAGFSDSLRRPLQRGTCSSCHSTPNAGSHSVPRFFNTGTADGAVRTADLPLYTLKNIATGETIETSDPGVAMISGKWADIGKVKVPTLRAVAARAPHFHNGSAAQLIDVVRFYERRFRIGLSPREQDDLAAFLASL